MTPAYHARNRRKRSDRRGCTRMVLLALAEAYPGDGAPACDRVAWDMMQREVVRALALTDRREGQAAALHAELVAYMRGDEHPEAPRPWYLRVLRIRS